MSLTLALVLLAETAHAAGDDRVTLEWSAPAGCPSSDEVSARTAARLPPEGRVRATGRVTNTGGRFRLTLEIASKGERVLEATTCEALTSSAVVVLAMSVAPPVEETEDPRREADPPPAAPPSSSPSPAPAASPDRPIKPEQARTNVHARVQAAGDVGMMPALAAGGGIALGIDGQTGWYLEAFGNLWGSQDGASAGDAARGATFRLVTTGAQGCWVLHRPLVLAPCLGAEAVVLSAHGFGSSKPSDATSVTWAPDASFTVGVPIGPRFMLRAGIGAAIPMSRQAFVIARGTTDNVLDDVVHRPAVVSARGWLGPEVIF